MNKKVFISVAITFFLTFYITSSLNNNEYSKLIENQNNEHKECKNKLNNVKNKVNELRKIDIGDYFRLQSLEKKYKKADEILGKILLIFMADLGIKLNKKEIQLTKNNNTRHENSKNIEKIKSSNISSKNDIITSNISSKNENWKKHESNLENIDNEESLSSFLHNTKIKNDITNIFTNTKPISINSINDIKFLFGNYYGILRKIKKNGNERIRSIEMKIKQHPVDKDRIKYKVNIEDYGYYKDNPRIGYFFQKIENSNSFILSINQGKFYFKLYWIENLYILAGHAYRKSPHTLDYEYKGTVTLDKQL